MPVSPLASRVEGSHERWRQRDLTEEHIAYFGLDTVCPKVPSAGNVVSLLVLLALSVKETGEKAVASAGGARHWVPEDLASRRVGRPPGPAADSLMAQGRCPGKVGVKRDRAGNAARSGNQSAPCQNLSALPARPAGPSLEQEAGARTSDPRA